MFPTEFHTEKLKDKNFKILYLFEEQNEGLSTYIHSFIYELEGLRYRVNRQQDSILQTIISDLEHMYSDSLSPSPDIDIIRREIFGHMSLFNKLFEMGEQI